ncbi:hypothetical protein BC828DRAFT_372180 [Blastocladiella britannica]|nr:hypothetical protein BC828DRAFT_372180 [Blastocladiella britannica]
MEHFLTFLTVASIAIGTANLCGCRIDVSTLHPLWSRIPSFFDQARAGAASWFFRTPTSEPRIKAVVGQALTKTKSWFSWVPSFKW